MYFVYALYNDKHRRMYIGQTNNLPRRLEEHNSHSKFGARSTRAFDGEWQLVYSEEVTTRSAALKRESQLKGYQGRKFIKELIKTES